MLAKIRPDPAELEPSSAEELADILFEIGRSQNCKSQWLEVIFWLGKAHDAISGQELQALSCNAEELQIGIFHGLARAFINEGGEENRAKAWDIIHKLDVECGNRLVVLLLKLDAFALDSKYSPQDYCEVLQTIVRTVHLTDTNIKTILHHVHKLRGRSSAMAHTVLSMLLSQRLLGAGEPKWLEKVFVTIIWNSAVSTDLSDVLQLLAELLDTLASGSVHALSPSATHAAQIVSPSELSNTHANEQAAVEAHRNQLQSGYVRDCRSLVPALSTFGIWRLRSTEYGKSTTVRFLQVS